MSLRVLLADDHQIVRAGLRAMLDPNPEIEVVGEACDGAEAIALVRDLDPDVVLMELRMPEMDGVAAIARLRELAPAVPVLVLTTHDTDADIVRAIEAGATGYLLKDATREELLHAIRSAATGRSALAPSVASRLVARMAAPAGSALSANRRKCAAPARPRCRRPMRTLYANSTVVLEAGPAIACLRWRGATSFALPPLLRGMSVALSPSYAILPVTPRSTATAMSW